MLGGLIFAQTGEAPFTSWAQLAVFLVAVGMVVNWLWKFIREKRNGPNNSLMTLRLDMASLRGELTQINHRLEVQGDAIQANLTAEREARHDLANKTAVTIATIEERLREVETALAWIRGARKPPPPEDR